MEGVPAITAEQYKALSDKLEALARTPAAPAQDAAVPDHPPAVRKGESALTSRPFRLTKLLGVMAGKIPQEDAQVEIAVTKGFRKALEETGGLHNNCERMSALMPIAKSYFSDESASHDGFKAYQQALANSYGSAEVDRDELSWLARNGRTSAVRKSAMSYLDDTIGGSLVAPPEMGDLIPLMRNQSAVDRAGAQQFPLPPQGKWVAPRITGPTTGYWVGESTAITESNPTTGEVSMMAKKLGVLVRVPNELFKFATAATDAMLRQDMAKTLALGFDYACLYGTGSGGQPKGILNYTGTNELLDYAALSGAAAPKGIGTDGNALLPQDGYRMAAQIAQRNFDVSGSAFIMTPILWGTTASYRSDAISAGDQAGVFVQALTRALSAGAGDRWCERRVVQSAQVRSTLTKGSSGATLTEVFFGVWSEFLMGMYGAVEFATMTQGDTTFPADQTVVRGILHCDAVPKYPGAFAWYKLVKPQ